MYVLIVKNHKFVIHEAGQGTVGSEALAPISSPVLIFVKCCRMSCERLVIYAEFCGLLYCSVYPSE